LAEGQYRQSLASVLLPRFCAVVLVESDSRELSSRLAYAPRMDAALFKAWTR